MGSIYRIKKWLFQHMESSVILEKTYYTGKYYLAGLMRYFLGRKGYARWFYKQYTGKQLNLDNPKSFNEKLWWLKLNDRNALLTRCSDKNAVREYVKEAGYPEILIPQLDLLNDVDELNLEKYGCEVVAKCTHNSGGHIFYNPKSPMSEQKLKKSKSRLNFLLHHNASILSLEWNYKNIPPKIVVEKVLRDEQGNLPNECRIFCFDGEPRLLMMDFDVGTKVGEHKKEYFRNVYDKDFNLLPIEWGHKIYQGKVKKPDNFEKMFEVARKLSSPFVECRIDLYNLNGRLFFGEITFFHNGASRNIVPEEWALRMGNWIDLSSPKIVRKQ